MKIMKLSIPILLLSGCLSLASDILYCDSGGPQGGAVFNSGLVLSSGGFLSTPLDIAVNAQGLAVVACPGRLVRVDGAGTQSVLVQDYGTLGSPYGVSFERTGNVLVATGFSLVKVGATGQMKTVTVGRDVTAPVDVAVSETGEAYVLDVDYPPAIVRVSAKGNQSVISQSGLFVNPQGIVVSSGYAYVTDSESGNFGVGKVIRVNLKTGAQKLVSTGGNLVFPIGITVYEFGDLIVADPYTINPQSVDLYDGAIIRIDPVTGAQTILARGGNGFVNPVGVAIRQ